MKKKQHIQVQKQRRDGNRLLFMKSFVASAIALCVVLAQGGGYVVEEALFSDGPPPLGWTVGEGAYVSPSYSNAIVRVAFSYAADFEVQSPLTARLYAVSHATQSEVEIASLNTATTAAAFDLPPNSEYRAFRIAAESGFGLSSFAATWLDTRLDAPTNIVISNNTGTSFDIRWDAVAGAVGYKVSVYTNIIVGMSAGTEVWLDDFSRAASGGISANALKSEKFNSDYADQAGWLCNSYIYPSTVAGAVRLGGGEKGREGVLTSPPLPSGAAWHLRMRAWRYSADDGTDMPIEIVSGDVTNRIAVVTFGNSPSVAEDFMVPLPPLQEGDRLIFHSFTNKKPRVILDRVALVTGYSAGEAVSHCFAEVDAGSATSARIDNLPPVLVDVRVRACASNAGEDSAWSLATCVDLANPPPIPVLAVPGSDIVAEGYHESFNALTNLPDTVWSDGVTLPFWQARKGTELVDKITVTSGPGGKSGGLYAYRGTNRADMASYSLSAVANGSNRMSFGFAVTNDTDGFLSDFRISFKARQWTFTTNRVANQSLRFSSLVTNELVSVSAADGAWTEIEALRFDAVRNLAASGVQADAATGSVFADLSSTLTGVRLRPGEILHLRWVPDPVSNGDALGVDDVSLTCDFSGGGMVIHIVQVPPGFR